MSKTRRRATRDNELKDEERELRDYVHAMSSTSLIDMLQETEGRTEFPFPPMDPPRPHTPSTGSDNTPPYLSRTLPSGSLHSSTSSRRHHRQRSEHESDRHKDDSREGSSRILSRISSGSHRDVKHLRTLLVLTSDRLESETRRADQAEQRVVDVLQRLRAAHEATAVARGEASRAQQEVRLYQIQLEQAQREILRAQGIVDELEKARLEAEEEAARSRSKARKCREQWVLSKAREQGRQEGFMEGLERGRRMALAQAQGGSQRQTPPRPMTPARMAPAPRQAYVEDEDEDEENEDDEDDNEPYQRRAASAPIPDYRIAASPPPQPVPLRPRQQVVPERRPEQPPQRTFDVAPIADTLPVPTITTPVNAPSPSHERPPPRQSPRPLHIPDPARRDGDPVPIPIREAPPSPVHPRYDIPPDNYIPYARDDETIPIPPPHEFLRPVTPVEASPAPSEAPLPPIPPPSPPARPIRVEEPKVIPYEPSVRSRDYAYRPGSSASRRPPPASMRSPQSRTSTRISEYDLVGPPKFERVYREGVDRDSITGRQPKFREGRAMSPRGPRAQTIPEEPMPAGLGTPQRQERPPHEHRDSSESHRTPLQKLFRKRNKQQQSPPEGSQEHSVPAITVESPSTDNSRPSSGVSTTAPHLLSPEHAHRTLPSLADILGPPEPPKDLTPYAPDTAVYTMHARTPVPKPSSPYVEAPVPSGVVYPAPPGRTKSRASVTRPPTVPPSEGTGGYYSPSLKSRKTRGSMADSLSGRLSPLSFGMPFSSFSAAGEGR